MQSLILVVVVNSLASGGQAGDQVRPEIHGLAITEVEGGHFMISGKVVDDTSPTNGTIAFTGFVVGTVTVDTDGTFTYVFSPTAGAGVVSATFEDADGLVSEPSRVAVEVSSEKARPARSCPDVKQQSSCRIVFARPRACRLLRHLSGRRHCRNPLHR